MPISTVRPARSMAGWAAACLMGGAAAVAWWGSGIGQYHGPDHMVGPYTVPVALEYAVGAGFVASAVAVLAKRPAVDPAARGVSRPAAALMVAAAVLAALLWRVMTAGVDGGNIGGGMALLVGPFAIAGLLVGAVCAERHVRGNQLRRVALRLALALLTAPVLFALGLWGLQ